MPLFRRRQHRSKGAGPPGGDADVDLREHRRRVGGFWERMGAQQLAYLTDRGLQPHHRLLDIGCGSLRGGVHLVRHLQAGHYAGIDRSARALEAGRRELAEAGLSDQQVQLTRTREFDFDFGMRFDFALAQSVFTHLPLNTIQLCLNRVQHHMVPGGQLFATYFPNPHGRGHTEPIMTEVRPRPTYPHKDPYYYDVETFAWLCEPTSWRVSNLGGWDHPRGQHMLHFVRQ
jgi:cyclopropane fatty-acyl-phospholipid synthase-like methyltransferase